MKSDDTKAETDTVLQGRTDSEHIVQTIDEGRNKRVRKLLQRMHGGALQGRSDTLFQSSSVPRQTTWNLRLETAPSST